jgi:hypothetical protein
LCILKEKSLLKKEPESRIIRTRQDGIREADYTCEFRSCTNAIQLAEANRTIIKNMYHNRHKKLEAEATKITCPIKAIRDDEIKFVPRPHRPWYLYWFTRWISFGKETALSRAWFIPTALATEPDTKTKEEKIKEQGQFCESMLRKIGFAYKFSEYEDYKKDAYGLRSALYEFAWAIDAFKKTEKLHKAEKTLFAERLQGKSVLYTTTQKRGCNALQSAHEQIVSTAKTCIDIFEKNRLFQEMVNRPIMCMQLEQHGVHPMVIKKFFDNEAVT